MVSFISLSQGISLCLLVSSLITGSSAVPISEKSDSYDDSVSTYGNYTLPPYIHSRCAPPPSLRALNADLESESYHYSRNVDWYKSNGGDLSQIDKNGNNQVGGMTLDLPKNAPPFPSNKDFSSFASGSVVPASSSQIQEFTKYAGVAATAYCRSVVPGNNWDCKQCKKFVPDGKIITTFTSFLSDTNGYVLRSDQQKTIYVVFRGTNSFRSAITDIVFHFSNYNAVKGAKVHTGFLSSYNQIVKDYFPVVQNQLTANPDYKVIVTGHSLGGAQALLAGMDLYQRDKRLSPKNLSIFTAGSPRVGNPTFAYYVESTGIPYHRTVHKRDIVPHVPPQAMGFLHPGVESWITSDVPDVQICTSTIETKDCSNSIVPFTSIVDHLSYFGINEGSCL